MTPQSRRHCPAIGAMTTAHAAGDITTSPVTPPSGLHLADHVITEQWSTVNTVLRDSGDFARLFDGHATAARLVRSTSAAEDAF